jgi:hypothetical protein
MSIDSVFINKTLDFYEITVQISGYGDDFKLIPISLFNENKLQNNSNFRHQEEKPQFYNRNNPFMVIFR